MDVHFGYRGTVSKVSDGDTVVADLIADREVDIGFGITQSITSVMKNQRIRLAGMDAKPIETEEGTRATEWLKARTGAGTGRKLYFATVKNKLGVDQHEKYGRWLIYIFNVDDKGPIGESLNEEMIAVGLAKPWDGKGPHPV